MAKVKWTEVQQTAIDARRGTLLVSAAAGSGKTAVLVERVIQRLTDPVSPCSVENLLVVTFTNAAAAQMKRKISEAITAKIAEEPENTALRRQQLLLPLAKICTIDSFCINLARENFQSLGVSPDFAVLEQGRLAILQNEAINTVLDGMYENLPEGFSALCELVCDSKDDSALISAILKLYKISRAYPMPEKWLDGIAESYRDRGDVSQTVWGRQLYSYLDKMLSMELANISRAIELTAGDAVLEEKYAPVLEDDLKIIGELRAELPSLGWDEAAQRFASLSFGALGRVPRGYGSEEKDLISSIRKDMKTALTKKPGENVFVTDNAGHLEDLEALSPAVNCLIGAVKAFSDEFTRLKREENGVDFDDTLHMAINLLACEDENGALVPSAAAKELSADFTEILIDEYQDVNEAQDILFRLLSKDGGNLFMVGDVKQSIYGFRMAMPEIFLEKRNRFPIYKNDNYPATVVLGKNFRSRSGVTGNVNYAFSRLMTEGVGGLSYGEADKLYYNEGGYADRAGADAELHYITCSDEDEVGKDDKEIAYIADYIEKSRGTLMVKDGDTERPADYGDFCVLFRSLKGEGAALANELEKRSIPVVCDSAGGFFEAPEIRFMLSLLRILDNPLDDVSMLAVMLSPVFGFTPDELCIFRAAQKKGALWHAVVFAAKNGDEKAAAFLSEAEGLRNIASTVSTPELIRRLLDKTDYYSIVSAMKDAGLRRLNLSLLVDYATRYEASGRNGLSGFLRYIDKAEKSSADTPAAVNVPQSTDVVRIMTIHKSKGLEFPVVILAGTVRKFNAETLNANMLVSRFCGVGIKSAGEGGFVRSNTVVRAAARTEMLVSERAEELRVLYVALTRAKEKFVITAPIKGSESFLKHAAVCAGAAIEPFAVISSSCFAELIASAYITHPDAVKLRKLCGASGVGVIAAEAPLEVVITDGVAAEKAEPDPDELVADVAEKLERIRERAEYVYPHSELDGVPAKRVASDFSHGGDDMSFFACERPAFMSKKELTPTERGLATHKFMEHADFAGAAVSVEKEIERLCADGELTGQEAEAVEADKVKLFFESELYKRIEKSGKVLRETGFTCAIKAKEAYPGLSGEAGEETVVVDGVADLAFVEDGKLVIVDYKTDRRVTAEELALRYSGQLSMYRRCLSAVLNIEVSETLLYSFYLGKTVKTQKE